MTKRTVKNKPRVKSRSVGTKKTVSNKIAPVKDSSVVCFNRDCKLRKKKSCKGFEGCPGFKGR